MVMEEIGIVKEINGIKAIISVQKQGSCGSCPGATLCQTLGAGEALMEAYNHVGARAGDTVKVVFKSSNYLKGTMLVYGLPSLMLIVGAVLGKEYLGRFFPGADPDILSAGTGFGFLIITFLVIKLWSNIFELKKEFTPIIEEIINRG
ncbi:MAG: SoxR reducing system RseC family protein [Dissulfurispiraceae bacterium]